MKKVYCNCEKSPHDSYPIALEVRKLSWNLQSLTSLEYGTL